MPESRKDIYDFNELEDMFEAIDTLTRATAVITSVDQRLADDLAKITATLIELSQRDSQQTTAGPQTGQQNVVTHVDLDDLTTAVPGEQKKGVGQENGEIIDVLTGQPINK